MALITKCDCYGCKSGIYGSIFPGRRPGKIFGAYGPYGHPCWARRIRIAPRPPHALSLARAGSRTLPSHGASEREERDSCAPNKIEHLIGALPNNYNSMHAGHMRRIFLLQFHPSAGEPARSLHAREADRNAAIVCMYAH